MERDIEKDLVRWKDQNPRLPLLIRGARQVGKTYIIEKFGKSHFKNVFKINFEFQPEFKECFQNTLDPVEILNAMRLISKETINPGETLLFLDEIQECPRAILALRYFRENLPELHVIGAGSLLEFTLNSVDFRMPVGRLQYMYLKPLSFAEFLTASGHSRLREHLDEATLKHPVSAVVHEKLLKLVREYMILGGMPLVVQSFLNDQDLTIAQEFQSSLLVTYRQDFSKYTTTAEHRHLDEVFGRIPRIIARNFVYRDINPEMRSREIKVALGKLQDAGLVYSAHSISASGVPLGALVKGKKFKIFFLDVGLVLQVCGLAGEVLHEEDVILVNRGAIAEQFVGQELLAYHNRLRPQELFFWHRESRGSSAEVDFVVSVGSTIVPIEVKSGTTGRMKSLQIFLEEKNVALGVRISQHPLQREKNILSIPFYMIQHLPRLVNEQK